MRIIRYCSALAAGLLATSAQASNLGYTMLGLDLTSTHYKNDVNLGLVTMDSTAGAKFYGSYQLNENFFLMLSGQAESATTDDEYVEFTQSVGYFGGGFALPVGTQTDVVMKLAHLSVEQELCYGYGNYSFCGTREDDGYGVGAGLRHMATQNIEVNAEFTHVELDDWEDVNILNIGGGFWFMEHHSIRLTFGNNDSDNEDAKTSALGYRYTF